MPRVVEGKLERISAQVFNIKEKASESQLEIRKDDGSLIQEWFYGNVPLDYIGKKVLFSSREFIILGYSFVRQKLKLI